MRKPWGNLLGNKKIERIHEASDKAEQVRRLLRIMKWRGINGETGRDFMEAAIWLAGVIDPAMTIAESCEPMPEHMTPAKCMQLYDQVQWLSEQPCEPGKTHTIDSVIADLQEQSPDYWGKVEFATLKRRYQEEKTLRRLTSAKK